MVIEMSMMQFIIRKIKQVALCRLVLFASLTLLAACAGNVPTKSDSQTSEQISKSDQAGKPDQLDARARADFSAAMLAIKTVEYEKTIRLLNKVTEESPNNPVPFINLAIIHKIMKNNPLAEKNLNIAIQLDPFNPVANQELALLYRKTGRFTEARQVYEKILTKYPNFTMARKNLGILCDLYMRDYKCAIRNYEIYSAAKPDDAPVKIWIADLKDKQ